MSGAALFAAIRGKKVYLGMLERILGEDNYIGFVHRSDHIKGVFGSFFSEPDTPINRYISDLNSYNIAVLQLGQKHDAMPKNTIVNYLSRLGYSSTGTFFTEPFENIVSIGLSGELDLFKLSSRTYLSNVMNIKGAGRSEAQAQSDMKRKMGLMMNQLELNLEECLE